MLSYDEFLNSVSDVLVQRYGMSTKEVASAIRLLKGTVHQMWFYDNTSPVQAAGSIGSLLGKLPVRSKHRRSK